MLCRWDLIFQSFGYETVERGSPCKESDRVRGTRKGGSLGVAVEKARISAARPMIFSGTARERISVMLL
ncbi:MAG: hypothetical protein J6B55_06260 [Clostridia bacterium]|nr:hypothetical protein [Clostridia bacterium]